MRMVTSQSGARIFVFESNADILEYTDSNKFSSAQRGRSAEERARFVGRKFEDWEDVKKGIQTAWEQGMEILQMSVERLQKESRPEMKSRKRETKFDDSEGDEFDFDRYMAGQQPFRSSTRETHNGPGEITIITDTTTSANYEAEDILWRGAVALALTKLLEEKGYRVELWVINGSFLFDGRPYPVCTACCLKRCSDPLDISTLVNTVSGWFYRTATFTLLETIVDKNNERLAWGLGRVYTPIPEDLNMVTPDLVRIYSSGCYSFSGAIQQVRGEVERFKTAHNENK